MTQHTAPDHAAGTLPALWELDDVRLLPHFQPRQMDILRASVDPRLFRGKQMAFELGMTEATLKSYCTHIYQVLGWKYGSMRLLSLWAIVHAQELGFALPTPEQFDGL